MAVAAFLPLISTAISSVTSLFTKNADVKKAETDLLTAQQAVLVETQRSKQAGYTVDVAKLKLLEKREETAQLAVTTLSKETQQKKTIGLFTIGIVLVFLFGIGFLFVKFVLPIFYPKPTPQPQNVVVQD